MTHSYDTKFMDYTDQSSRHSATRIAQMLLKALPISSVLDIGCAKGTWLKAWSDAGASDIQGVDGEYVRREDLVVSAHQFKAWDLSQQLDLGRQFDLVQSLEVAEHIKSDAAQTFVENLARHSRGLVLFSAAPPGQGGEFHINEQPYDYWRGMFAALGFEAYDYIRPQIADDSTISFWYRYNIFLYAHRDFATQLPTEIQASRVATDTSLSDISPALFKFRKFIVRALPESVREGLARFKANYLPSGRW